MAIFASFARRRSGGQATERELPEAFRRALPMRFEAVGEALLSGVGTAAACSVAGRALARDGASLDEALDGLRTTYALANGSAPSFRATEALATAWSEESLKYLHQLSCEDPLTGLTSLAHVRTRLSELYREAEHAGRSVQEDHALVVVELTTPERVELREHRFTRVMRMVQVGEAIRAVFFGGETIGRLGLHRAVAVVRREAGLGGSVAMLGDFIRDLGFTDAQTRVWIEGLPTTDAAAALLLDELARPA